MHMHLYGYLYQRFIVLSFGCFRVNFKTIGATLETIGRGASLSAMLCLVPKRINNTISGRWKVDQRWVSLEHSVMTKRCYSSRLLNSACMVLFHFILHAYEYTFKGINCSLEFLFNKAYLLWRYGVIDGVLPMPWMLGSLPIHSRFWHMKEVISDTSYLAVKP